MTPTSKPPIITISDDQLRTLQPQYEEVRQILSQHRLCWSIDDLAAHITLRVIAMTWRQVRDILDAKPGEVPGADSPAPDRG